VTKVAWREAHVANNTLTGKAEDVGFRRASWKNKEGQGRLWGGLSADSGRG
jgi:hypothetical protein